jgi:hypothetical protein
MLHSNCAVSLFRHGLPNCPVCRDDGRRDTENGSESDNGSESSEETDEDFEDMVTASTSYASIPSLNRMVSSILRNRSISRAPVFARTVLKRCKNKRDEMQAARRRTREFEIIHRVELKTLNRLRRSQVTRERHFREAVRAALLI